MEESRKAKPQSRGYDISGKMIPLPPGTKNRGHFPHDGEESPSPVRHRLLLAGLLVAVLAVGIAVGRFLLP